MGISASLELTPVINISPAPAATPPVSYVREPAEILGDVARAAVGMEDLRAVLQRVADLTMEATGADRVSLFLLDEREATLKLWAAVTTRPTDDQMWDLGQALPPIDLDANRAALLGQTEPVAIADARSSELVPSEWAEAFDLGSLIAAPLSVQGEALGLLVADYSEPRDIDAEVVRLVGAVAGTTALAVRRALMAAAVTEHGDAVRDLVEAARALNSARTMAEVAQQVTDAIARVLGARHVAVQLVEGSRYRTIAHRGVSVPPTGSLLALPRPVVRAVIAAWKRQASTPVFVDIAGVATPPEWRLPATVTGVLVLPLHHRAGTVFGFVLVGWREPAGPARATVEVARALSAHISVAVEQAQLDEQLALGAEFSLALLAMDDLAGAGPEGLADAAHRVVPHALGFEVMSVRLHTAAGRGRRPRRHFDRIERQLWEQWRGRRTRPDPVELDGFVYAPLWGSGRVLGTLCARPRNQHLAPHERDLLLALAGALGEVQARRSLRQRMEHRDRELALAQERSEVAAELHLSVGRVLATIADSARRLASDGSTDARRIATLAASAEKGLRQMAGSLELLDYDPMGLEATIGRLVAGLGQRLDAAATADVVGDARPLPLTVERAMVRVVHEALSRVGNSGHASAVAVTLRYDPGEVVLRIRDDGAGLGQRDGDVLPGAFRGLRVMTRRLESLGGSLTVEPAEPRGLLLVARVPA